MLSGAGDTRYVRNVEKALGKKHSGAGPRQPLVRPGLAWPGGADIFSSPTFFLA